MRTAFVTGASRGIGRAIALRLAKDGYTVGVGFFRNRKGADEACAEIAGDAFPVKVHTGDETSMQRAFERFDRLDVFVSNAASGVLKPLEEIDARAWAWTMDVNARALLLGAQLAAPRMQDGGTILAVTSAGSHRVLPNYGIVGASKAALESLVRYLAVELAPDVRVNAVSPGVVDTDALRHFPNREELLSIRPPSGRPVTPDDVAELAAFLCSPSASQIRGQTVVIDGGAGLC